LGGELGPLVLPQLVSLGSELDTWRRRTAAEWLTTALGGRLRGSCKQGKKDGGRNPLAAVPMTLTTSGQLKVVKSGGQQEFPQMLPPHAGGFRRMLS